MWRCIGLKLSKINQKATLHFHECYCKFVLLFIFKQENASEIFAEGEEIVSRAARNIEIVSNVAKTFVQTLDFSEMNGFSLTYERFRVGMFPSQFQGILSNGSKRCGRIVFTQKFRGSAENIICKVDI